MGTAAVETVVVAIVAVVDNRSEVAHNWVAVAVVVVATAFAIIAADIADMGLVVVASCIPLST